jgi:TM2 domain-containing membrane protein YozV
MAEATIEPPVTPLSPNSGKFWPAFLLALFLGIFGAHRFYLQSPKRVLMLLTLGGFGIWAFIDIITILLGKFKDDLGQTIANPKLGVSWGIFILLMTIGSAGQSEKPSASTSKSVSAVEKKTNDIAEKTREPYCGIYLSTTGQFRGSLTLSSGGSCQIKFGNGGSTHYGNWSVEGNKIRVQTPNAGDTVYTIESPRRLSIYERGIDAEYDRI